MKYSVALIVGVGFLGCSSEISGRMPASADEFTPWDRLPPRVEDLYARSVEFGYRQADHEPLGAVFEGIGALIGKPYDQELLDLTDFARETSVRASRLRETLAERPLESVRRTKFEFSEPWRGAVEYLRVVDLSLYPKESTFRMSMNESRRYALSISNFAPLHRSSKLKIDALNDYYQAQLRCDRPFDLVTNFSKDRFAANQTAQTKLFTLTVGRIMNFDALERRDFVHMFTEPGATCFLNLSDPNRPEIGWKTIRLRPEAADSLPSRLLARTDFCEIPVDKGDGPLRDFFLSSKYGTMTCPEVVGQPLSFLDGKESLRSKVRSLTGHEMTDAELNGLDPYFKLNVDRLPKLDAIAVGSLYFRSDFTGTVLARALEKQAERGTPIYILISSATSLAKDRRLLYGLAARFPNVKVQEYRYIDMGAGLGGPVSSLHRVNHVKMFLGVSRRDPSASFAYIGGRNIHDGFSFKPKDLKFSRFPELIDYANRESRPAFWRDYEARFDSPGFAESSFSSFLKLYHRDFGTGYPRPQSLTMRREGAASLDEGLLVRSLISYPVMDQRTLESSFVEFIDAAQASLLIATPYFRPTKPIVEAFRRAAARGVKTEIVTRLDLKEESGGQLMSEVNVAGVNEAMAHARVWESTEPEVILHSKIAIADGKLAILGSVNLNHRSFLHDLENALLVYSERGDYVRDLVGVVESYKDPRVARELTKPEAATKWKRLIDFDFVREAF